VNRTVLYGLVVESNVPIPGPTVPESDLPCDVAVTLGAQPRCATRHFSTLSPETGGELHPIRPKDCGYAHLLFEEGVGFSIHHSGSKIWATWPPNLSEQDAVTYLVGVPLGYVLSLRGVACLHGSAVVVDGKAVLCS
jgi:hypothetical protein